MPNSIPIPQVRLGKRKARSQMFDIFTEDGRIPNRELDVKFECGVDADTRLAFLIDDDNLYQDDQGNWVQAVSERNFTSLCMLKKSHTVDFEKRIDEIYVLAYNDARLNLYLKTSKNALMDKILWIIAIPSVSFLLIAGLSLLKGH